MPTYEYECTTCGHAFEVLQSIIEKPLSRCPKCKGSVHRVIHGGMGVIFKGSGFYTTDYKRSSALTPSGDATGGSTREKPADKPKDGTVEKKPAEKTSAN